MTFADGLAFFTSKRSAGSAPASAKRGRKSRTGGGATRPGPLLPIQRQPPPVVRPRDLPPRALRGDDFVEDGRHPCTFLRGDGFFCPGYPRISCGLHSPRGPSGVCAQIGRRGSLPNLWATHSWKRGTFDSSGGSSLPPSLGHCGPFGLKLRIVLLRGRTRSRVVVGPSEARPPCPDPPGSDLRRFRAPSPRNLENAAAPITDDSWIPPSTSRSRRGPASGHPGPVPARRRPELAPSEFDLWSQTLKYARRVSGTQIASWSAFRGRSWSARAPGDRHTDRPPGRTKRHSRWTKGVRAPAFARIQGCRVRPCPRACGIARSAGRDARRVGKATGAPRPAQSRTKAPGACTLGFARRRGPGPLGGLVHRPAPSPGADGPTSLRFSTEQDCLPLEGRKPVADPMPCRLMPARDANRVQRHPTSAETRDAGPIRDDPQEPAKEIDRMQGIPLAIVSVSFDHLR